ncbi:MAG: two-component system chemotaxis sensor kinase CheA, partial [Glaciecola sp.]
MSFEVDEEIMQDFLVEAGELLEQLQVQLVDLENKPEDAALLNAIFRGYHTVKGGAGFLALTELVNICHGAENVFDTVRNGQRTLTPELMDVILQATDIVVDMFEKVKLRKPLEPAPAELIAVLHKLSKPETADESIFVKEAAETAAVQDEFAIEQGETLSIEDDKSAGIDEITDDEFEALLDELHGTAVTPPCP